LEPARQPVLSRPLEAAETAGDAALRVLVELVVAVPRSHGQYFSDQVEVDRPKNGSAYLTRGSCEKGDSVVPDAGGWSTVGPDLRTVPDSNPDGPFPGGPSAVRGAKIRDGSLVQPVVWVERRFVSKKAADRRGTPSSLVAHRISVLRCSLPRSLARLVRGRDNT